MSTHQDGREDQVLRLFPDATAAEAGALVTLLTAAGGPAPAGELPGEAAALAAFRAAQRPPARAARRAKVLASLTTLLTVKTATAALAVTTVGGIAIATGHAPAPLTTAVHHAVHIGHHSPRHSDGVRVEDRHDPAADAVHAGALRDAAHAASVADGTQPDPTASYGGLCTAFAAGQWDNTRAAGNPAFSRLLAAAPSGDVSGFCQALATEAPAAKSQLTGSGNATAPGQNGAAHAQQTGKSPSSQSKAAQAKAAHAKAAQAAKVKAAKLRAKHHHKTASPSSSR